MTKSRKQIREIALRCASRGWAVLPLHWIQNGSCSCSNPGCQSPGKHPLTEHGVKNATKDEATVRSLWKQWPSANVGIATGAISGLVIIDVDPRHQGEESLNLITKKYGPLPDGPRVRTGGGGQHLYFSHPGFAVKSKVGLYRGIDIRADGAYVVAVGSRHASGGRYLWQKGKTPAALPLPAMPEWVPKPAPAGESRKSQSPLGGIPEGARNATLASMAGSMRKRGMCPAAIEVALLADNRARCSPPLSDPEVKSIAASVSRYPADSELIVSTHPENRGWAERKELFRTGAQIAVDSPEKVDWVARPWVAAGAITEIDGKVKVAGKTTFATHLVRAALDGACFMGEPTTKTTAVFLTEQNRTSFRETLKRADLLGREDFVVLFWKDIIGLEWPAVARLAVEECKLRGASLLVVDTMAQFAGLSGDGENSAGEALKSMQPLQEAAAAGLAVVMLRHERKSGGAVGDSGRGSSAFAGAVDIIVSISRAPGGQRNARLIRSVSRFDETPDELLIELEPDGYRSRGEPGAAAREIAAEEMLDAIPEGKGDALTIEKIVFATGKKRADVQRKLERLQEQGKVRVFGKGVKNSPFRYYRD